MKKIRNLFFWVILILALGLLVPQDFKMPVQGATKESFNQASFWYYPWGRSGTHKGVDIFSRTGTAVCPSTSGLVIYCGNISMGGNVVAVLGPKWRIHYYAHLNEIKTHFLTWVNHTDTIGTVGTSGNAKGKTPHLHYSIVTLIPYVWRIDTDHQGWKKMFYVNPIPYLNLKSSY